MRADLPRQPERAERDSPDLSTFTQRFAGAVAADALHVAPPKAYWTPLGAPVPGRLVEGTLPEDHRARFVLRIPGDWNGRLVVAASSGITDERTYDLYFSDYALSHGYAFAATDKGVRRAVLDGDTVLMPQGEDSSIRRWTSRLEELARAARRECLKYHGKRAEKVYAVGLSNGGFIARKAAESAKPEIDGAVEVSGVMWRAEAGGVLRELPRALRGDLAVFGGLTKGWDPVVSFYRAAYWEAVVALFLNDLDPDYRGALADYELDRRPEALEAIRSFENTGELKVPLISVAGAQDLLISCPGHALAYRDLVARKGKSELHELRVFESASHIDTNAEMFPFVKPLMPAAHEAFEALVARVEGAATAPSSLRRL
jgi:pimeloyl-ACP methyl ester carboxylesterase